MSQLNPSPADQEKVMELIKNLQGQIECLKGLYGLRIDAQNSRIPEPEEITGEEHGERTISGDGPSTAGPSNLGVIGYPDSWNISWDNKTLLDKLFNCINSASANRKPDDAKYSLKILSSDVHTSQRNFRCYTEVPKALGGINSEQVIYKSPGEVRKEMDGRKDMKAKKDMEIKEEMEILSIEDPINVDEVHVSQMPPPHPSKKTAPPEKAPRPLVDIEENTIHITDFDWNNKIVDLNDPNLGLQGFKRVFYPVRFKGFAVFIPFSEKCLKLKTYADKSRRDQTRGLGGGKCMVVLF